MKTFVTVEEALNVVLDRCTPLEIEWLPLDAALGRTLAAEVRSEVMIPPFDNSAMDGYAVCAADVKTVPSEWPVWDEVPAGRFIEQPVPHGTAVRIMTGAPLPDGVDTVVPREEVEEMGTDRSRVRFVTRPEPNRHVRRAGEDVLPGQVVLEEGRRMGASAIGMMAALGVSTVRVRRRPAVAVVTTGSELVDAADVPGPGSIRDSNGPALAAQARECGAEPVNRVLVPDNKDSLQTVLAGALEHDVVVVSGGVSVGDYDHVKAGLLDLGVELLFWKVRQRPGKPLTFGVRGRTLFFGLPGNPVSSSVCFDQYVRPALLSLQGRRAATRERVPARLTVPLAKGAGLHHFVRGIASIDDNAVVQVRPTGPQGSNLYTSMVVANCLIHVPESVENPPSGSVVQIEWLDQ